MNGTTKSQYDGTGLGQQTDGFSTTTSFTALPDGTLLSKSIAGTSNYAGTYYYVSDGAGSVAALTDSNRAVRNTYSYDPLGNATTSGTVPNPFTFQGWQYDSITHFYYTGSGYYSRLVRDPDRLTARIQVIRGEVSGNGREERL